MLFFLACLSIAPRFGFVYTVIERGSPPMPGDGGRGTTEKQVQNFAPQLP
jgi:hypothetical protein